MNNKWDIFVKQSELGNIHQTSSWGEFQKTIPYRGKYRIIPGMGLVVRYKLPKGFSWLYCPRGPLCKLRPHEIKNFLSEVKKIAKKERAIFLRIDPPVSSYPKLKGFREVSYGFQPEHTLILDLTQSKENILAQMKQKGRYNIRLAEKKGVVIRSIDPKDKKFKKAIITFHNLLKETFTRDKFKGHDAAYYENMVRILGQRDMCKLYLAEYRDEVIAGIIVTFFKDTAIYYFGASGNSHRNVMAPYLLQWTAIKEARRRGCKVYDFLGIAPSGSVHHPWAGVTEFKKKFGGKEVSFAPTREYAFKPLHYYLYRIYKFLRLLTGKR
ncbi:peptidoglycan bridge formation glycyltransferase FemA/FemB family protein [Candidatus Peregrinibacteria bacterium]|nr:peptidoglycan bridge formation glycyltransferase FemA/FemB family protein [Candidatus Peregrinibacteria bacterium]